MTGMPTSHSSPCYSREESQDHRGQMMNRLLVPGRTVVSQMPRLMNLTPGGQLTAHLRSCHFGKRGPQWSFIIFKVHPFLEDIAILFKMCQCGQDIPREIVSYEVMRTSLQTICKT